MESTATSALRATVPASTSARFAWLLPARVDMATRRHDVRRKQRLTRRRDGYHGVTLRDRRPGAVHRLHRYPQPFRHLSREPLPPLGRPAVHERSFQIANLGNGFQLRFGLKTATDHPEPPRLRRARQRVATPVAAPVRICPRAFASMTASSSVVSASNSKTANRAPNRGRVAYTFAAEVAALVIARRHAVQPGAIVEHDPAARMILRTAVAETPERLLHQIDRLGPSATFPEPVLP